MKPVFVTGTGFWSPGYADWIAFSSGKPNDEIRKPSCNAVHTRLGRGTSRVTRMAVEVAYQALAEADVSPGSCASVFGSAYGELRIAIEQLDMMREGDGIVSPARFKNSVHNTAGGIFSISAKNPGFTTSIAAGSHTLAATLLEAVCLLQAGAPHVVAGVADEDPPEPIRSSQPYAKFEAIGVGLTLSAGSDRPIAIIRDLVPAADGEALEIPGPFVNNPCAPALGLLAVIKAGKSGRYAIAGEDAEELSQPWVVEIECL